MTNQSTNRTDRQGRYRSLSNFYLADARRIASREHDMGLWWRVGRHGPISRAAWVRDTGELYVTQLGPAPDGGGEVHVLGIARDRNELEQALKGWREICHQPDSMTWLRHRAASLRAPEARRSISRELPDRELPDLEASPREPIATPRRRVNSKLLVTIGATAGVTAPATALLLELASA